MIEKAREVQTHLQSDQLPRVLHRRKHQPHGKADGHANQHLLHHQHGGQRGIQRHHRHLGQGGLGCGGDEGRQRDADAQRHVAPVEDGQRREQRQHADEGPYQR
jgi:hypothetical protein